MNNETSRPGGETTEDIPGSETKDGITTDTAAATSTGGGKSNLSPLAITVLILSLITIIIVLIVVVNKSEDDTPSSSMGKPLFPHAMDPPSSAQWSPPGGGRFQEYVNGSSPYLISEEVRQKSEVVAVARRRLVKAAMQHAWNGYGDYAYGKDEVLPVSKAGQDNWGGVAMTLVDSLSTLWLMNMTDEFWKARDYVRDYLDFNKDIDVIAFEFYIRQLGGLLSAYDLSGDPVFLEQANDLAPRLFAAFDPEVNPTGIPYNMVNLKTGKAHNLLYTSIASVAQAGTMQLEFRALDAFTNNSQTAAMRQKAENVYHILRDLSPPDGLYPILLQNNNTNKTFFATDLITFGADADSFYEYLLKVWIQGDKTEPVYREMYDQAIQGLHDKLLFRSTPSGLAYLATLKGDDVVRHKMPMFSCFAGGLLALGAYTDPLGLDSERAQRDLTTARALTYTCYQMNARMKTGISADQVEFTTGLDFEADSSQAYSLLRPEAVESFYVLHALTGDPIYREWGWEAFEALETYSKTEIGYSALKHVDAEAEELEPLDETESFFLAETLKYLYLLFDSGSSVDILKTHVFNTEAHPLRVFSKTF